MFREIAAASQRIPAAADVHNIGRRLSTGWHLPSPALERNTHTVLLYPIHTCCAKQSTIVVNLLQKHPLQGFDQFAASMKASNCIEGCEAAESAGEQLHRLKLPLVFVVLSLSWPHHSGIHHFFQSRLLRDIATGDILMQGCSAALLRPTSTKAPGWASSGIAQLHH